MSEFDCEHSAGFKMESGQLVAALNGTGIAQVVKTDLEDGQVSYLCRVHDDSEGQQTWLDLVTAMLRASGASKGVWDLWVAKRYFLKPIRGKQSLVYGWAIILSSGSLGDGLNQLRQTITETANDLGLRFELESMPLPHVTNRDRNAPNARGRGAASIGSAPAITKR